MTSLLALVPRLLAAQEIMEACTREAAELDADCVIQDALQNITTTIIPELIDQCSELGYEPDLMDQPFPDVVNTSRDPDIAGLFREEGIVLDDPYETVYTKADIERKMDGLSRLRGSRRQERYTEEKYGEICQWLPDALKTPGAAAKISLSTGIPHETLSRWHAKWEDDPLWRPWLPKVPHAERRCVLTDSQMREMETRMKADKELMHGGDVLAAGYAMAEEIWMRDRPDGEWPGCHPRTMIRLLTKCNLSWRRVHVNRRPSIDPEAEARWHARVVELLGTAAPDRVLNGDETNITLYPDGKYMWAPKGSHDVQRWISGNKKTGFTVMATVDAAGGKLPLFVIAKGKTRRCERGLEGLAEHKTDHSDSGWQNMETMMRYLNWLRELPQFSTGELHLIIDCYSVHKSAVVRDLARTLGIILHFIPPGLTDKWQPLDRLVFGALKSSYRAICRRIVNATPGQRADKGTFALSLLTAWNAVKTKTIVDAWSIYRDTAS